MGERLLTTSYRYEVHNPNAKMLRKSLAAQNTRIQVDELIASRQTVEQNSATELERSIWLSSLDEKSEKRRIKRELLTQRDEVKQGNKELLLVRRAKLKTLFENDRLRLEQELNATGKAFYFKRV